MPKRATPVAASLKLKETHAGYVVICGREAHLGAAEWDSDNHIHRK